MGRVIVRLLWLLLVASALAAWVRGVGPSLVGRILDLGSAGIGAEDVEFLARVALHLPAGLIAAAGVAGLVAAEGWLARGSAARKRVGSMDVVVCRSGGILGGPVVLQEKDRYLHMLVVGPTGAGKSSMILKPMIEQDLEAIARLRERGKAAGLTLIEPKGDLAEDVARMAASLDLPVIYLDPTNPATPRFNPLQGDAMTVAEIMRTVLRTMFGRQDPFFRTVQEQSAKNTTLLLKRMRGDDLTVVDLARLLRDQEELREVVELYAERYGQDDLVSYFQRETMGQMGERMYQFALGLRLQLEDLIGNAYLRRVLDGRSDLDLDAHLAGGGVLVVNTAMGPLGKAGDVFGQFVMMHFQGAVFRRPGTEFTRPPHVLYVDEFPRYLNPDFERLLAIGRSYRCATVLAIQDTAQLLLEERPAFRDIVMGICRNKIVFGGIGAEDARLFEREFGQVEVTREDVTYRREGLVVLPWREMTMRRVEERRSRFSATDLMELPARRVVYKLVRDGVPMPPGVGRVGFARRDRRRAARRRPRGGLVVEGLENRERGLEMARVEGAEKDNFWR